MVVPIRTLQGYCICPLATEDVPLFPLMYVVREVPWPSVVGF